MAFAIFYNMSDLDGLRTGLSRSDIPQADRGLAQAFWNAGVNGFASASVAPETYRSGDSDCRVLVIDGRHQGQTLTLAQFRALLGRLSTTLNLPLLAALAKDMGSRDGAKEPWP